MDSILAAARKRASKFSLAVLSSNVLFSSLVAGIAPFAVPTALAAAPACTTTLNGGDNIQTAITAATAGDVICLNPGMYTPASTISVTKSLTIIRTGCDPNLLTSRSPGNTSVEAVVDGNNATSIFSIANNVNNVTIACLEITDGTADLVTSTDAGTVRTGIVIKNNIVHDSSTDEGIQLKRTNGAVIQYNDVYDVAGDGINISGNGTINGQILDNKVHDVGSTDGAIYVYNSTNTTIEGNLLYDVSGNDAIKLGIQGGGNATGSVGGTISDNVIVTGSQDAISVYMSDVEVFDNKIKNSNSANGAIYVAYASNNVNIHDNLVVDNNTTGIKIGGAGIPTNVAVNDNCIEGNNAGLNLITGSTTLDAEDNWWGDASGPSGSGPGTGDSVNANVDFTPFNTIGCDLDPIIDNNPTDGIPDGADDPLSDTDSDGVPDASDNCPADANPGQEDTFGGPEGDACETPPDTAAPNVPTHLSPADNVTLTTSAIGILDWTDETDPSSPVTYIYQSATNPATNPDGSFVTPAYTSGNLSTSEINAAGTPEGTYYWHVRSVDALNNMSDWSAYWTIHVDNTPRIVVDVTVVSDDGGTNTSVDVTSAIDGNPVIDGDQNAVSVGGHVVSGNALAGYDMVIGGDCAADGSLTVASQDLKTCSITYDDIAPTLTLVKTVNNNHGGTKDVPDFPLYINGNLVSSGVPVSLSGGVLYTASETSDPGYQPSDWGTDCATDGTITLAVGENKTCTVTNSDISATVTVNVTVNNNFGGTETASGVTVKVDGNTVNSGDATPLVVGPHSITGSTLTGYTMTIGGDCASDGTLSVNLADVKTCTITYNDIQPLLTVTKVMVNDDGGTMFDTDFPLFVGATSVTTGVQTGFNAATYVVSETGNSGYAATFSGDCSSTGALNLGIGEVKSCTITNDDIAPTLTVTKVVVNDNGGTSIVTDFPLYIDGNLVTSGVAEAVTAGTHTVSELSIASEYEDVITGDCDGSGSITLALAQNATCYITNDDKPAHIIVIKDVVNDNGGTKVASDFVMNVSGNNPDQTSFAGSDIGVDVTIDAGSYDVTEDADSQYVTSYSADCSGSLLPGETKTCTITNDDIQPLLTVIIAVTNDNVGSAGPADFTPTVDGSSVVDSVPTGINAGVRLVSGFAHPGITGYTGSISGDCDFDGEITLLPGDVKSCTVHFDDVVPDGLSDEQQSEINDVGNGTSRGNGTSKLQAAANFVTGNLFGSIAPGAFGGGPNVPFSTAEVDVICAMQDALPSDATNGLIEWLAEYLASIIDRDADQVLQALKDSSLCPEPVQEAVVPAAPVALKVNAAGYPVSSNATWNKCITGRVSLLDIRNNPDKDNNGLARDCSDYHTGNVWYHPDLLLFFTFDKKNKMTIAPQGYIVQKEQAVSLGK